MYIVRECLCGFDLKRKYDRGLKDPNGNNILIISTPNEIREEVVEIATKHFIHPQIIAAEGAKGKWTILKGKTFLYSLFYHMDKKAIKERDLLEWERAWMEDAVINVDVIKYESRDKADEIIRLLSIWED